MSYLSTKCALGRTLNRMRLEFPQDYDFFPLTFVLPTDRERLIEYASWYAAQASAQKQADKGSKGAGKAKAAAAAMAVPAAVAVGPGMASRYFAKTGGGGAGSSSSASAAAGDESSEDARQDRMLGPPAAGGCWFSPGQQPQPQAAAGDRLAFIVKPDASSRGCGIYLALKLEDIAEVKDQAAAGGGKAGRGDGSSDSDDSSSSDGGGGRGGGGAGVRRAGAGAAAEDTGPHKVFTLVQAYLPRPLLMDERKFDLRIYGERGGGSRGGATVAGCNRCKCG